MTAGLDVDVASHRQVLAAVGEGLVELRPRDRGVRAVDVGFGGDAANVCVMAARAGVAARLAGRVGTDPFGRTLVAFWEATGVDVRWVVRDAGATTGLYMNEVAPGGAHHFSYWRKGSAGSRLLPADVPSDFLLGAGMLVVTGVTLSVSASAQATATAVADRAQAAGIRLAVVVNHRPALQPDDDLIRAWAQRADVLLLSAEDAAAVPGLEDAARPDAEVVRTAGTDPAVVRWADGEHRCAIPRVAVADAAGAGDAVAGTYLAARLMGTAPPDALRRAVTAASLSVTQHGCAASYPSLQELDAALGAGRV